MRAKTTSDLKPERQNVFSSFTMRDVTCAASGVRRSLRTRRQMSQALMRQIYRSRWRNRHLDHRSAGALEHSMRFVAPQGLPSGKFRMTEFRMKQLSLAPKGHRSTRNVK